MRSVLIIAPVVVVTVVCTVFALSLLPSPAAPVDDSGSMVLYSVVDRRTGSEGAAGVNFANVILYVNVDGQTVPLENVLLWEDNIGNWQVGNITDIATPGGWGPPSVTPQE
jgi:hypothetical protein